MELPKSECEDSPRVDTVQEQLSALDTISHLLTVSNFDLGVLLNEIVRIAAQQMRVKGCAIRLLDRKTGEMVLKGAYGLGSDYLQKGPVIAARSAFRQVIESGEAVQIYDVSRDSRLQYSKEAITEGICSMLTVGLMRDGRAIGALSVYTNRPHQFTPEEIQTFQTIANQAALAVYLTQLHQKRLHIERIEQELAIASEIQTGMMPSKPPHLPGVDIFARTRPCEEIGGDLYDFFELEDHVAGLAVGDVSGKGIPAALLMVMVHTLLRSQCRDESRLHESMQQVNEALYKETTPQEFATLFYALVDAKKRRMSYINAGHNFPVLVRNGEFTLLEKGGMPLGMFPDATFDYGCVELRSGDLIAIYTDGFNEAMSSDGEQFGTERLYTLLKEHKHLSSKEILEKLEQAVDQFEDTSQYVCDDRTAIVFKVL